MCAIRIEIGFLGAFGETLPMIVSKVSRAAQHVSGSSVARSISASPIL